MHPDFIAGNDPAMTSFAAYSLWPNFKTTPYVNVGPEPSQFDYWSTEEQKAGRDILVIVDGNVDPNQFASQFEEFNKFGESLTIERYGYPLRSFQFYYGENYIPQPAAGATP
jgi:hypothetical protein